MQRKLVVVTILLCAALGATSAQAHRTHKHHRTHRHHHGLVFASQKPKPGGGTTTSGGTTGGTTGGGTTTSGGTTGGTTGGGGGGTSTGCAAESLPAKPGGGSWTCSFDDEFDSTTGDPSSLNSSWWVPQVTATSGFTTGWPYVACYENSPNNISVSGGALHLTVRKEATPVKCLGATTPYTGGMVSSYNRFTQTYGRFEVRAQLPPVAAAGLQETLWLWPANDTLFGSWPGSGEVDFSEFYSQYSNLDVPYIHYDYDKTTTNKSTNTNVVTNYCQINLSQYNDYAVVWQPGSFQITINGTTCLTDNYSPNNVASPAPFNQPFFIALTQALGAGTNALNPSTTPLPATTNVDYVRVWK